MDNSQVALTQSYKNGVSKISIKGALVRETADQIWTELQQAHTKHPNTQWEISLNQVTDCDSIGLVSLLEFKAHAKSCLLTNIPESFKKLLDTLSQQRDNDPPIESEDAQLSTTEHLGKRIITQAKLIKTNITYLGEILYYLASLTRHPSQLSIKKLFYYLEDMGPKSVPLVMLVGILFGVILSFQSVVQLKAFGAEVYVANLVSVSLVRELGPLLVAIVMMGRSASAYAAEISAMNVNQEIDALKTMGLDPVPYLILPRLIAAAIISPLLTLIMNFSGMFGCLVLMQLEGFTKEMIIQQMFVFLSPADLASGLIKSMFFGLMIISIGCINGLNSERDAMAVGRSATNTVVKCIISITIMDGVFTTIFFYLGL